MHLLLLCRELGPSSLLLQSLWSRVAAVLLGDGLLLLALHSHLLHLLLHDEVLLLLLEKHQLFVLAHAFKLVGRDFGVHHELFVAMLEGVALQNLLLLG